MSDDVTLIPISDEQAKLGQEIIKAFSGIGSFFRDALGSVPTDLIGYLGGDWLRMRRAKNIVDMLKQSHEILEAWCVHDTEPASLTLALPILRGAADESREELQNLWARLMAATLDPSRAGKVRQGFAEVISKMDPTDALVMNFLKSDNIKGFAMNATDKNKVQVSRELNVLTDELETSIWHLANLGLVILDADGSARSTPFGREFLRVITD